MMTVCVVPVPGIVTVRVVCVFMRVAVTAVLVVNRLHAGSDRHVGYGLRVKHLPEQEHERRPEQRE
jgi:hypothetical protein